MIDIPVEQILQTFDKTSFVDVDVNSTRSKLLQTDSTLRPKIDQLIQEDITGLYADITNFIDNEFRTLSDLDTILVSISSKLAEYVNEKISTDMNPVADALGRDKYDFVSSSFLISQLALGVIGYVKNLLILKYNINSALLSRFKPWLDFETSAKRLNMHMMARHFELLAKLLKPSGVLHLSATTDAINFSEGEAGNIITQEKKPLIPFELLENVINLFFSPQTDFQTSWQYVKEFCTPSKPIGEFYITLSIPCIPKQDTKGLKVDEWTKLS